MNNVNSTALLRSLVVYAVCVPLAILVGWMLANPLDYQSVGFIGIVVAVVVFPLLMRWHYPLLVFSLSAPITVFFLPSHPNIFLPMVVTSLSISVVERILNKEQKFLPAAPVRWSLLILLAVVYMTAELTGGFGLRSMGSSVYGGKKYVTLIVGALCFFALSARGIPKKHANRYLLLFFVGSFLNVIMDMYQVLPPPLHFIYVIFPISERATEELGGGEMQLGVTRLFGISTAASGFFYWMLARYGFRGIFFSGKFWRPILFFAAFVLVFLGGFRSFIVAAVITLGLIFFLEKMHQTKMVLLVVLAGIAGAVLLVPLAPHLPYTFQRALAFLPLDISPEARMNAEASTEWRLSIWQALLPEVPKYLLLGKGYSFSAELFNNYMGYNATFKSIDAADNPLALSSDFHSGPLSVIIPFGIWGVFAWLGYWAAGFFVVWRNYRYGDPAIRHINLFMFASFIGKCIMFLFVFGGIVEDVGGFATVIGLSIAFNHGIMRPRTTPRPMAAAEKPALGLPARPAFQR